MKYSRYIIALLIICFLSATTTLAQEDVLRPHGKKRTSESEEDWTSKRNPIIIGVEAGLNINLFSQNMVWDPNFPHGTIWNGLSSANGLSPHFGVLVDVPINKTFAVQLRASYDMKDYGVSTNGTDYDVNGFEHDLNLKVDVKSSYVTLTPLLRINATENLFFTVGPTFHFLAGDIETTWSPNALDNSDLGFYPFWGGMGFSGVSSGSITVAETQIQKSSRIGIEGGVGYKIPLSKSIYLVPQGRFQLMFTPVTSDTYWVDFQNINSVVETSSNRTVNTIQLALALWFEL
jgi:hypothetical protein